MYPINYPAKSSVSAGLSEFMPWLNCQDYEAWILRRELPVGVTFDELTQRFNEEIFPRLLKLWEPRGIVMTTNREELIGYAERSGDAFEEEDVMYEFSALGLEDYGEPPNFLYIMAEYDSLYSFVGAMYLTNVPDNQSVPLFCNAIMGAWAQAYKEITWDENLLVIPNERENYSYSRYMVNLYQRLEDEGFDLFVSIRKTLGEEGSSQFFSNVTGLPIAVFANLPEVLDNNLYDQVLNNAIEKTCGLEGAFESAIETYGLSKLLDTEVKQYSLRGLNYIVFDRDASSTME